MRTVSKHLLQTAALPLLLMLGGMRSASAQDNKPGYIPVHIKVYNVSDIDANGNYAPFDQVVLYQFETEAEGIRAARQLSEVIKFHKETGKDVAFVPADGCYIFYDLEGTGGELDLKDVSTEGSLLFLCGGSDYPFQLIFVRGRSEIEAHISAGLSIDSSVISTECQSD